VNETVVDEEQHEGDEQYDRPGDDQRCLHVAIVAIYVGGYVV
jgi:hypothetical protein